MEYILSAVLGYLLGSFPAAYIFMKKAKGIDITTAGTGNVGAMNSYEVSNSKMLGALVLLTDALKGLLSVYIPLVLFPVSFIFPALGLIFSVLSHCYNPWLGLKGGRGLATAAGGSALLFPYVLVIWLILYITAFLLKKDILFSNIFATIFSLFVIYGSANTAINYTFPRAESISSMLLLVSGVLLLIFTKHIEPFKELLNNKTVLNPGKKDE